MSEHRTESAEFDAYAGSYEEDHRTSVSASGEDPSYFHEYKIACLTRKGLLDDGRRLRPGRYTLLITVTDAATGNSSKLQRLKFTIIR